MHEQQRKEIQVAPAEEEHEQQRQRNCRDHLRIDHRDLRDGVDHLLRALFAVEDADCAQRAEHGRTDARGKGEQQRVPHRSHELLVLKELFIQGQGKAVPGAQGRRIGEAVQAEQQDGRIHEGQDQENIALGEDLFYHSPPPRASADPSPNLLVISIPMPIMTSRTIAIALARFQLSTKLRSIRLPSTSKERSLSISLMT